MKIVFAGTPVLASTVLTYLIQHNCLISAVLTKPDAISGRHQRLTPTAVKDVALKYNLQVLQPTSLKSDEHIYQVLSELQPDIIIVVAYGIIFPQRVLQLPKLGCVNLHLSILPKYRGAAPVQRAIMAGDSISGITLMRMNQGLDTGDILLQQTVAISTTDTSSSLYNKLIPLGCELLVQYLYNPAQCIPVAQIEQHACYAHKIDKQEAQINWHDAAEVINLKIRAFNSQPGCFSYLNGSLIKIWQASVAFVPLTTAPCGTIINVTATAIIVACGNNTILAIEQLQVAGRTKQLAHEYILGHPDLIHQIFSNVAKL